jgi:hypothetical protein
MNIRFVRLVTDHQVNPKMQLIDAAGMLIVREFNKISVFFSRTGSVIQWLKKT